VNGVTSFGSEPTLFRSPGRKLMLVFEHRMVDLVGSRFKQLAP
jgi:hypothetical protein